MPTAKLCRGFTIVELLTVIAIIAVLVSLLFPAVQAARESARTAQCQNHLRQIGLGMLQHEGAHRHFPTGGWGFRWVGDPYLGYGRNQPGGWIYNILPFIEEKSLREIGKGTPRDKRPALNTRMITSVIPIMNCPSRRSVGLWPYTSSFSPTNVVLPPDGRVAKADYAVNAGDRVIDIGPGPTSLRSEDLRKYKWPDTRRVDGISYQFSDVRMAEVSDGASNTIMNGEKYIPRDAYLNGGSRGDDQTMYVGDDPDIARWTSNRPQSDKTIMVEMNLLAFGGPHRAGSYFVFCDGAVRKVAFSVDRETFRRLGNRSDGLAVDVSRL